MRFFDIQVFPISVFYCAILILRISMGNGNAAIEKKKHNQQLGGVSADTSVTLVQWQYVDKAEVGAAVFLVLEWLKRNWCIPHLIPFYKPRTLGFKRKRDSADGYSNKYLRRYAGLLVLMAWGNSAYEDSIDAQRPIQVLGLTFFSRNVFGYLCGTTRT